uniref:GM22942 n=1 Tax=Solanum tuberosum TaxID=4113 RepID=M1DZW5_SOLTU
MGVWEETPKSWNWKSFSKTTVPIALCCNGLYDDMIASVIEAGEFTCEPNDLAYIEVSINARPPIEPTNSFNDDNDSIGNERLGDHSKKSLGDNSNESLGDHSMNIHDDPTNVENQPVDAEDPEPECCEEMQILVPRISIQYVVDPAEHSRVSVAKSSASNFSSSSFSVVFSSCCSFSSSRLASFSSFFFSSRFSSSLSSYFFSSSFSTSFSSLFSSIFSSCFSVIFSSSCCFSSSFISSSTSSAKYASTATRSSSTTANGRISSSTIGAEKLSSSIARSVAKH